MDMRRPFFHAIIWMRWYISHNVIAVGSIQIVCTVTEIGTLGPTTLWTVKDFKIILKSRILFVGQNLPVSGGPQKVSAFGISL